MVRRLEGHGDLECLAIISLISASDTAVKVGLCHDNLSCKYCKVGKSDSVPLDVGSHFLYLRHEIMCELILQVC